VEDRWIRFVGGELQARLLKNVAGVGLASLNQRRIAGLLLVVGVLISGCGSAKEFPPVTFRVLDPATRSPVERVAVNVQSYRHVIGPGAINKFRRFGETDPDGFVTVRGLEGNLAHSFAFVKSGYMSNGAIMGKDGRLSVGPALPPGIPWAGEPESVQNIASQPIEISLPKLPATASGAATTTTVNGGGR
jgi:hypothetical protein